MKHQNRIAQRIISAAIKSGRAVFCSEEFKLHDDTRTDLLNRLGSKIPVITLSATVYMTGNEIENVQLSIRTDSLRQNLNFYNVEDANALGEQIAWAVNQLKHGNGRAIEPIKTPEDDWEDYQAQRMTEPEEYEYGDY